MNAQSFLALLQAHYDFTRADFIFNQLQLKNCWKPWLTTELTASLGCMPMPLEVVIDDHYQLPEKTDKPLEWLSHIPKNGVQVVTEKRHASRCDFRFDDQGKPHYVEIRCANKQLFQKGKEIQKYLSDIERITAFKKKLPDAAITALFAFYGAFDNEEVAVFKELDNAKRVNYVLDTGMTGSSSIARLSHLQRAGEPRLFIAAFSL